MSEEAFLRAVIDQPDDDGPRLVYADWLDEHGDADRAAFIRTQCALALRPDDDDSTDELRLAEHDLLTTHEAAWAEPFGPLLDDARFRRGFLEMAQVHAARAAEFLHRAPALCSLRELRFVAERGLGVPLADLLVCPLLDRLDSLTFHCHFHVVGGEDWSAVADPATADGAVRQVASCPRLIGLCELGFIDHWYMTPYGLGFLAEFAPPGLRRLDLSIPQIDADQVTAGRNEGIARLARAPRLARLTGLGLRNNGLSDAVAQVLAASPALTNLEQLDLSDNEHVGDAGLRALAASANLAPIRVLSLEGTGVTAEGAEALARSPHVHGLRELDLRFAPLGRAGLRALAAAPWDRLERLALGGNRVNDAGVAALADAALPALRELELKLPQLSPDGLCHLAHCPWLERLTTLNLNCITLTPMGAAALVASLRLGRLRSFALNLLQGPCAVLLRTLGDNPALAALRRLDLGLPSVEPDDLRQFAATALPSQLTDLTLTTRDEIEAAEFLAALTAADLGRLRTLDLGDLELTDAGAAVLTEAPRLPMLRRLRCRQRGLSWRAQQRLQAHWGPRFQFELVERRC